VGALRLRLGPPSDEKAALLRAALRHIAWPKAHLPAERAQFATLQSFEVVRTRPYRDEECPRSNNPATVNHTA
jgi:hypothetical protein